MNLPSRTAGAVEHRRLIPSWNPGHKGILRRTNPYNVLSKNQAGLFAGRQPQQAVFDMKLLSRKVNGAGISLSDNENTVFKFEDCIHQSPLLRSSEKDYHNNRHDHSTTKEQWQNF